MAEKSLGWILLALVAQCAASLQPRPQPQSAQPSSESVMLTMKQNRLQPPDQDLAWERQFNLLDLTQMFWSAGCVQDEIHLGCPHNKDAIIVIENATFYSDKMFVFSADGHLLNCSSQLSSSLMMIRSQPYLAELSPTTMPGDSLMMIRDLRQALNRRCSGMSNGQLCHFNLHLDYPESATWASGFIKICFRCISNKDIVVLRPSGMFFKSPVYPKYYVGRKKCRCFIRAQHGQRIVLRLLDISLKEEHSSPDGDCADSILVRDSGRTLAHFCREASREIRILSSSSELEVRLESRGQGILSRRGVLAEFWSVGCSTPREPTFGYISHYNVTHAMLMCNAGYAFQPSLQEDMLIECATHQGLWMQTVPDCVPQVQHFMPTSRSADGVNVSHPDGQAAAPRRPPVGAWWWETVLPLVVVATVATVATMVVLMVMLVVRTKHWPLHPTDSERHVLESGACCMDSGHGGHMMGEAAISFLIPNRPIGTVNLDDIQEDWFLC